MNNVSGHAVVLTFLVLLLGATAGAGLTGVAVAKDGDAVQRVAVQQTDSEEDQNETSPHRNPDNYSENGDLEGVEGWLTDRMSSQLGEGAIQLSEGEYELAKGYIDEEYQNRLEQYVDVAGETEGNNLADEFENASEKQSQLTDAVQEYRETKAEYEAAREAGDEGRARELARELETLANEINSLGGSVRESYDSVEAGTGADLSEPNAAIEGVTEDIRSEQMTVREQEFVETDLTVTPERETISFVEPLVATGELRTSDGDPIADTEIRLDINNHTKRVSTDSNGVFSLEYRPTTESLSVEELEVRYVPNTQSTYLGDRTNVSVSIGQTEPTVSLSEASSEVAYGTEATVAGEVDVDGVPVDDVPLAVILDGQRIGTVTVTDGEFNGSANVPASVPDGETELRVRFPFEDRALAPTSDASGIMVRETDSSLSVAGTSAGDGRVVLDGTLATDGGDGIGGEPVQIQIDGTTVGNTTTMADGTFEETVTIPNSVGGNDMGVVAVYEGHESNIKSATAETIVTVGSGRTELGLPRWDWLAVGFGLVIVGGLVGWWYRQSGGTSPAPNGPGADQDSPATGIESSGSEQSVHQFAVEPLLERASDQLSRGRPDDAAHSSYVAVRQALSSQIDGRDALTHWEFYRTFQNEDETKATLLREVTEGYESAAFGQDRISTTEATAVLERAQALCGLDDPSTDNNPADD
ncbi:hypothetical protein [Natrinema sp. SYSU A 869]|uniref:hypothetical protein n=1 Tax=Natrinema sp. SYSU A 869 TaxID=2871694 RepID=UPI0021033851|nr:hypothetical protein [Natrinema sp. SYSU A 869]